MNVGLILIPEANNPERQLSKEPHVCMQTAFFLFLLLKYTNLSLSFVGTIT